MDKLPLLSMASWDRSRSHTPALVQVELLVTLLTASRW